MAALVVADTYPVRSPEVDTILVPFSFVGGSAAMTKVFGANIAMARTGTGTYTFTLGGPKDAPGEFLTWIPSFMATTASGVAGYQAVATWVTSTGVLTIVVYNASQAATDLAALQWLGGALVFAAAENAS